MFPLKNVARKELSELKSIHLGIHPNIIAGIFQVSFMKRLYLNKVKN